MTNVSIIFHEIWIEESKHYAESLRAINFDIPSYNEDNRKTIAACKKKSLLPIVYEICV